ncbi:MAG: hypothetical protein Q9195_004314 [Heterodermia aff. obscurata]
MSTINAPVHRSGLMNFALFPREIRNLIYTACLTKTQPITVLDNDGLSNVETIDKEIRQTFGVLDGDLGPIKFTDEAREVFYANNTFIVPLKALFEFLDFGDAAWNQKDFSRKLRADGSIEHDEEYYYLCNMIRGYFKPHACIRQLIVQIDFGSWVFKHRRSPREQLNKLFACSKLQDLQFLISGADGECIEYETSKRIIEIWDVIEDLYKKFGVVLKSYRYLCAIKEAVNDGMDEEQPMELHEGIYGYQSSAEADEYGDVNGGYESDNEVEAYGNDEDF